MKYTIVEITDKNNPLDKERGQVHKASDLRFARDNGDIITIVEKGDNYEDVCEFLGLEYTTEIAANQYRKDGSVKKETSLLVTVYPDRKIKVHTGMADWKGGKQSKKFGPNGQYITVFGQRWYID